MHQKSKFWKIQEKMFIPISELSKSWKEITDAVILLSGSNDVPIGSNFLRC